MTEARPQKIEINVTTGEEIVMDMTDEEIVELEAARAAWAEEDARATAAAEALTALKASAKAKLVAGQPLTEEEAATLII
jgi:hypothetical protein